MADAIQESPTTAEKQFRTLRPHQKSRLGCTNCKKRKVKCDETRPACGTCRLRKAECEYSLERTTSSSTALVPSRMAKANTSTNVSVNKIDAIAYKSGNGTNTLCADALTSFHPGPIDYLDMKVLWFYTSATCKSFSVDSLDQQPLQDTLQNTVVQSAFESPFLMKTLLALASLHMQSLGQDIRATRSLSYCGMAFEGHRKAIAEARPKSYGALLTNALMLSLLALPALRQSASSRLLIIDWMLMWNGIPSVFDITGSDCISSNGLDALFTKPSVQPHATATAVPKELLTMLSCVTADDEDVSNLPTYFETLRCLSSLHYHLYEHGQDSKMALRIITWFTVAPKEYVDLARARRPRAMVILAHYAAYLKLVNSIWWLAGVGDSSIYDIWHNLSHEWHKYVQLPIGVMGAADDSEVCCMLLNQVH